MRAKRRIEPVLAAMTAVAFLTSSPALAAGPASATAQPTASAPAEATPPDPNSPDALSDEAITRFKAKDYEGAADYFERAYNVDPRPNYLFNIGRVYEEAGQLPEAVRYYERFLREPGVDLESREIALQRLRVLRAIIAETTPKEPAKTEPEPEVKPVEPARIDAPPPEPEGPPPRARKLRIAGYTLLGLGGAGLVTGAAFGGIARKQSSELAMTDGYDTRQELIRVGQQNAKIADVALLAGGIVTLTGLVLVLVTLSGRSKPKSSAHTLSPMVGRDQLGLAVGGRF